MGLRGPQQKRKKKMHMRYYKISVLKTTTKYTLIFNILYFEYYAEPNYSFTDIKKQFKKAKLICAIKFNRHE